MIRASDISSVYRNRGPAGFVQFWHESLGLPIANDGRRVLNFEDRAHIRESAKPSIRTSEVSLLALAKGLISPHEEEIERSLLFSPRAVAENPVHIREAAGDIVPSAFANISTYNAAVIGLLEARILEAYQRPKFMLSNTVEHIPSRLRALKIAGVSNIGDVAQVRGPGEEHAAAQLTERFVTTPQTVNRGLKVQVTREAVMFDYTGEVLKQADTVGDSLALRKEYLIADTVIGVTNSYTYNGTTYNTYQATAADGYGGNYVNSIVNAIGTQNVWQVYNAVLQQFVGQVDPETGQPISIEGFDVLCSPTAAMLHQANMGSQEIQRMANALAGTYWPQDGATMKNPAQGLFRLLGGEQAKIYPYAYARTIASGGLNLSTTAATTGQPWTSPAGGRFWSGDFKKGFHWNENSPLTIIRANATDYVMADKGLVMGVFADERGAAGISDPRFVIESKTV